MKRLILFIVLVLALALFTINLKYIVPVAPAHSAGTRIDLFQEKKLVKSVVFAIGLNRYYVDGSTRGVDMDARPFIRDGRTFVPIRYLSIALGVEDKNILWDNGAGKVTLLAWNRVEMTVGSPAMAVTTAGAGRPELKIIDVSPILQEDEGRTYLPARYVAEALGYQVDWDEAAQTVLCWPRGEVKPDITSVKQKAVDDRLKMEGKSPQEPQKPEVPAGYWRTSVGYMVPKETKLEIEDKEVDVNITLMIVITRGDLETQFKQAEDILAGVHGRETAKEALNYARKKTIPEFDLESNYFGNVRVYSSWNVPCIYVEVWREVWWRW